MKTLRRLCWAALLLLTLAVFMAGMLVLSLDLNTPALHWQWHGWTPEWPW